MDIIENMIELFGHRRDIYSRYSKMGNNWYPKRNKNKELVPLSAEAIKSHMFGEEQAGVYSTRRDEEFTVGWVVADFDDNILAFDHAVDLFNKLKEYGIPSHIERSYSGKGYHLWVFFESPVPAAKARRLMLYALHQAGVPLTGSFKKGSSSKRSMDRLFPAQDFLGPVGFGNLVRIPLANYATQAGNCVFVDIEENVIEDQYAYIADILSRGRIAWDHWGIEDILSGDGPKINSYKPPTKDDSDYWSSLSNRGDIDDRLQVMHGCEAIKAGIEDANQFSEPAWQAVMSNIAVYGSPARDLAHEFSAGYDNRAIKNDMTAVYDADETDRKFYRSVDMSQRGQVPNSCHSLVDKGFECPRLTSCEYRFIAQYGMDPSDTVYPATTRQKELMDVAQEEDLYSTFKDLFLYTDDLLVTGAGLDAYFPPGHRNVAGKFERKPITEFDFHRHMFIRPIKIRYTDPKVNLLDKLVKWALQEFDDRKHMASFIKLLKDYNFDYFVEDMRVFIFFDDPKGWNPTIGAITKLLSMAGIERSRLAVSVDQGMYDYVIPPFSGKHSVRGIRFLAHMKQKLDMENGYSDK